MFSRSSFLFVFGLLLSLNRLHAQVHWLQKPSDYQLFPRNAQNQAEIRLQGLVLDSSIQAILLVGLTTNGKPDTQVLPLYGVEFPATFTFTDTLTAGLIEKGYQLLARRAQIIDTIWEVNHLCSGDVYVLAGQSNALAHLLPDSLHDPVLNPFVRTFGRPSAPSLPFFAADTVWGPGRPSAPVGDYHHLIGHIGFALGDSLVKRWGIPVCIINAARGSTSISQHQKVAGTENLNRVYDAMLYRCRLAGVQQQVKAIVWYQGESDAATLNHSYTSSFAALYADWLTDFPGLQQVYVFQISHGCGNLNASSLREEMRQLSRLDSSRIRVLSSMNIPHDGCHFYAAGYRKLAMQLIPRMAEDLFQEGIQAADKAPDLLRAVYTKPREIALVFNQPVRYDASLNQHNLQDYFFNEWDMSRLVSAMHVQSDTLFLQLNMDYPFSTISYTPSCTYLKSPQVYQGPYIYNENGWGAFTFDAVSVEAYQYRPEADQILLIPNPVHSGQVPTIVSATPYVIRDVNGRRVHENSLLRGMYWVCNQQGTCRQLLVQ